MKTIAMVVCLLGVSALAFAGPLDLRPIVKGDKNLEAFQTMTNTLPERYVLDDQYLLLCDYLSGTNTHERLGMDDLQNAVVSLLPPASAFATTNTPAVIAQAYEQTSKESILFQYLMALQVAEQRVGGVGWWETCTWHSEPWASYTAAQGMAELFHSVGLQAGNPKYLRRGKNGKALGVWIRANIKR